MNINSTPLSNACGGGHIEIVKLLLSVPSIDINNGDVVWIIKEPHCAKHVEVIILILSSFFFLSHRSMLTKEEFSFNLESLFIVIFETPLYFAVIARNVGVIKLLISFPSINLSPEVLIYFIIS